MKFEKGNVIFARVSPEQKLRIVKVLKNSGEIVAVTGDGANDAPSLKEADIGVAMGASGTDVAREAADIVLLDDSFASIVKAIESGRAIYENIRKFIVYVFSHNWAELIPFILYAVLGIPLPLLVTQVLAIDLAIDVIPSLALSREPPEAGIMQEPPRSIKERLFTRKVLLRSVFIGVIIAAGAMIGCLNAWAAGGWHFGMALASTSSFTQPSLHQRCNDDFRRHRGGSSRQRLRMQNQQAINLQNKPENQQMDNLRHHLTNRNPFVTCLRSSNAAHLHNNSA